MSAEYIVTMEQFGKLCELYGPLVTPSNNMINKIYETLQNE